MFSKSKILTLLLTLFLLSCAHRNDLIIDSSKYKARAKDSRIKFIILHYTALSDERSVTALLGTQVSSHYLVTTGKNDPVYNLVPESDRAWHAGTSYFDGKSSINESSIGIEIVNLGYDTTKKFGKAIGEPYNLIPRELYFPYTEDQIRKIGMLVKSIKNKYGINDKYIIGHSDIAPQRKQDPGPLFPWKRLHDEYGVGRWYNENDKFFFMNSGDFLTATPLTHKKLIKDLGYEIDEKLPVWDEASTKVVYAIQSHYRPERIDGIMDIETYAIIKALLKKYPQ